MPDAQPLVARASTVDVTVAVCTRNRAKQLRNLLLSLCRLQIPDGTRWSALIVDNGSTDATAKVLGEFAERLPLQVVFEARPGVAHARNAVIDHATGRWLLCTDDDITVPTSWMTTYLNGFRQYRDAAFLAGDIRPVFIDAEPGWQEAAMAEVPTVFGSFTVGDHDAKVHAGVSASLLPFAGNMAFVREHLDRHRFDTRLGRQPGTLLLGGEETQFINGLLSAGEHGWLVCGNPVLHWVAPELQTREYVARYFYGLGWQSGVQQLSAPLWQRLRYAMAMRAMSALFPVAVQFCDLRTVLRHTRSIARFRGAIAGRSANAGSRMIGFGTAGHTDAAASRFR